MEALRSIGLDIDKAYQSNIGDTIGMTNQKTTWKLQLSTVGVRLQGTRIQVHNYGCNQGQSAGIQLGLIILDGRRILRNLTCLRKLAESQIIF